jgi:hypothetical protein
MLQIEASDENRGERALTRFPAIEALPESALRSPREVAT